MESLTLATGTLGGIWPVVALIMLWLILMCLKTIGHGYYTAVCWHNLKVEAHRLRLKQQQDLLELRRNTVRKEANRRGIRVEDSNPKPDVAVTEPTTSEVDVAQAA